MRPTLCLTREVESLREQVNALILLNKVFADAEGLRSRVQMALAVLMRAVGASYCLLECSFSLGEDTFQSLQLGTEPTGALHKALQEHAQAARESRQLLRQDNIIAVPLCVQDLGLGAMTLLVAEDFPPDRVKIVETAAQQVAAIIYAADLLRREREAGDQLRELDKMRSDFVAMVSHELRTPLTCIKGFVDTLLRSDINWSETEQGEFLRSIKISSEQALRVVEDLLSVQQAGQGKVAIVAKTIDLGHLVAESCRRAQSTSSNHTILWTVPATLPIVRADFVRLSQVMDNLLHNAIKYSPLGGEVHVRVRGMLGEVEVAVIDHGVGIPPAQLGRVFDQFYRIDNSLSRKTEGLGLGLTIVRTIVLLHGGRVWAESSPGTGSTFYFTIPN
ncbi:MAG: Sensor protein kinase WalK [Firmicutes bacterium]|nr:Sensor protein kinase WalK [Bacillota bacterium]